jgi:NAD-dependent deacetylase
MIEEIERLAWLIIESKKIVMFTGAGVNTESGIPDFLSTGGVWSRYDPEYLTIQKFFSSHETRENIWKISVEAGFLTEAEPILPTMPPPSFTGWAN